MSEVPDVRPILLNCTSSDNVFSNTEALIMCERIISDMRQDVSNVTPAQTDHVRMVKYNNYF